MTYQPAFILIDARGRFVAGFQDAGTTARWNALSPGCGRTHVARQTIRDWVWSVERAEPAEQWTMLCFFAGRSLRSTTTS